MVPITGENVAAGREKRLLTLKKEVTIANGVAPSGEFLYLDKDT